MYGPAWIVNKEGNLFMDVMEGGDYSSQHLMPGH